MVLDYELPAEYEIEILDPNAANPYQQGPEFYRVDKESSVTVAVVRKDGVVATVEAVGLMDFRQRDPEVWVSCSEQLAEIGITTDNDMEDVWSGNRKDIKIVNNPWFEVWVEDNFSEPCWDIKEAVNCAMWMIKEELDGA